GLTLKALAIGTGTGITYTAAAALHVEDCVVDGWEDGIRIAGTGKFFINGSIVRNTANLALVAEPPSAALIGTIEGSRFENNAHVVIIRGGRVNLRNSVVSGQSGEGAGSEGDSGFTAELTAEKCVFSANLEGFSATAATGVSRIS